MNLIMPHLLVKNVKKYNLPLGKKCFTWRKSKQKFINIKMIPKDIFNENL